MSSESDIEGSLLRPQLAVIPLAGVWNVTHHRLFRINPDEAEQVVITKKGFTVWDLYFLQDLVQAENVAEKLLLDVGWYPHADPRGSFRMLVVRQLPETSAQDLSYDWEHPLEDISTRSVEELLSRIQSVLGEKQ